MKQLFTFFFCFIFGILSAQQNKVWTSENLPMPFLADSTQHVCNPDQILSKNIVDSVNSVLVNLETKKGIQTIVVVVNRVDNGDIYSFAMNLGRKYGIGSKEQNSGLLVVLSILDRKYYILTGYGLEGVLPDAICKRIENKVMLPYLKQQQWDQATYATVKALAQYALKDSTLKNLKNKGEDEQEVVIILFIVFVLCIILFIFSLKMKRECPICHKKTLKKTGTKYIRVGQREVLRTYWRCTNCGHQEYTDEHLPPNNGRRIGRSGLPLIFGAGALGSRSFGSGSFGGGGTFGGGSFGGGGAGGSF